MGDEIAEEDRTTGIGTIRFAVEYFAAAIAAHEKLENGASSGTSAAPVYALSGQALELSLKAFLRERGENLSVLKKLNHNLEAALDRAEALGLTHNADRDQVRLLNVEYSPHRFRYIRTGFVRLLEVQYLFALVAQIMTACMTQIPGAWRFMWHTSGKVIAEKKWMSPIQIKKGSVAEND